MLNELYIDPVDKEFLENHIFDRIELEIDVYIEDTDIRTYPHIAAKVRSLINNVSWLHDKIYLPDIILSDTILKEQNHTFKYITLDTVVYKISSLHIEGIDVHTGKCHVTVNVDKTTKRKEKNFQIYLAYSYGLN